MNEQLHKFEVSQYGLDKKRAEVWDDIAQLLRKESTEVLQLEREILKILHLMDLRDVKKVLNTLRVHSYLKKVKEGEKSLEEQEKEVDQLTGEF